MKKRLVLGFTAALASAAFVYSALADQAANQGAAAKIEKRPGSYNFSYQGVVHKMNFLPGPPVPLIPGSSERPPGGLTVEIWPGGTPLKDFTAEGLRAKGFAKIGCEAAGGVFNADVAPAPGATGGWLFHLACQ